MGYNETLTDHPQQAVIMDLQVRLLAGDDLQVWLTDMFRLTISELERLGEAPLYAHERVNRAYDRAGLNEDGWVPADAAERAIEIYRRMMEA